MYHWTYLNPWDGQKLAEEGLLDIKPSQFSEDDPKPEVGDPVTFGIPGNGDAVVKGRIAEITPGNVKVVHVSGP